MIAIGFASDDLYKQALVIAEQYGFFIDNECLPRLHLTAEKLVWLSQDFLPLFVDFKSPVLQRRCHMGKKQGLIRACKPVEGLRILDTTAGWGRDAALLASFGADVVMLERQPVMSALLADGLSRLNTSGMALRLLSVDAKHYLETLPEEYYPDVIYIDPMHPERQKSALVKKDMQVLQQLFGADEDAEELILLAINRARKRVVVKWPARLAPLWPANSSLAGKTVRFDTYIPNS